VRVYCKCSPLATAKSWRDPSPKTAFVISADSDFSAIFGRSGDRISLVHTIPHPNTLVARDYLDMLLPAQPAPELELLSGCVAVFRNNRLRVESRSCPFPNNLTSQPSIHLLCNSNRRLQPKTELRFRGQRDSFVPRGHHSAPSGRAARARFDFVSDFAKALGIPTVLMGFGLPDDGLHSLNEKYHLDNYYKGIMPIAHFFEKYGAAANRAAEEALGAYYLLDRIGQGGMGVIYRARDTRSVRPVAQLLGIRLSQPHVAVITDAPRCR